MGGVLSLGVLSTVSVSIFFFLGILHTYIV